MGDSGRKASASRLWPGQENLLVGMHAVFFGKRHWSTTTCTVHWYRSAGKYEYPNVMEERLTKFLIPLEPALIRLLYQLHLCFIRTIFHFTTHVVNRLKVRTRIL